MTVASEDSSLSILRRFFESHPTWVEAAESVHDGANSEVFFTDREGHYHLMREDGHSLLLEGAAPSPDFSFLFTPGAIDHLAEMKEGTIGDFAICIFDLITTDDPKLRVGFRVNGPFLRILRRGYLQVLLKGGPRVLQYAAGHGVTSLSELKKLLDSMSGKEINWSAFRGE